MPRTVFISYSHQDEDWKDRLVKHLGVLQQQDLLRTWNDRVIGAGAEWFAEIQRAMEDAQVAVLLISADSLTSKFILHTEVPRLLERRSGGGLAVFPVICEDCLWQEVPWLARLQVRPRDGKPLESFRGSQRNAELVKIAKEILAIVRNGAPAAKPSEPSGAGAGSQLSALHQLPSPPADFIGREEDLAALRTALAQDGAGAILGLRGMGGVGKTALALRLAEELQPSYPDAQLYLDLRGVDPQPLTPAQAMAHVVRSYHPEAPMPASEAELAGLYRSVLHGKRALLLMDNAGSREQVEPLIPPAGSLLLVSSRFRFTLPGLIARNLDELPEGEARDLLLRIAPRAGPQADEIARLCGRLPLALRLAGSALAERPDLSPSAYARRLHEGKERLDPVEASLDLSYELLSEERRRLWRLLTAFASTFEASAVAAVWEMAADPAQDALGELVRCSLVEWDAKEERYRLHDLARRFAERRLAADERDAVQRRHAEHFLKVLWEADRLYLEGGPGGASMRQALRLFDREWDNLQTGQAWAAARYRDDRDAARICSSYANAGAYLLDLRRHPRDQIRWLEPALAAARLREDRAEQQIHLGNLGNAFAYLGEPRRAIELYEQRLAIAREIGDRRGEGYALGLIGLAYADLGEHRRAIEFHDRRLTISREVGDRRGEGKSLCYLGNSYSALGEPQRAIEFYEQHLAISREVGDRRGEGTALGNLGIAHASLGELQRATDLYQQRLAIADEIGDRRGAAEDSWNLGQQLAQRNDLARAADLMQIRVDYERDIGHPDAEKHAAAVQSLRARLAKPVTPP